MSKQVMYQLFYYKLLKKIKSGELKNKEKIPSERTLCELYDISRTTVREALRNLEIDGYIERRQGSGSYVRVKPLKQTLTKLYTLRERFIKEGIKHAVKVVKVEVIPCNEEVSSNLKIPVNAPVVRIERVFFAADVPYTIEYSFLPRALFPEITEKMITEDGLYNTIEKFGQKPTSAEETIRVVKISESQKQILLLKNNVLAIETTRITCSNNKEIEYTKNISRNDFFIYTVHLK